MSTCCITALLTGGRKIVCEKRRSKKTRMRPGDSAEQPETASLFSPHKTSPRLKLWAGQRATAENPFRKGSWVFKKIDARGPGSESAVSLHRRSRSPPLTQRGPITLSPEIPDQGGRRSSRRASSSAPPPRRSRRTRSRWRPAWPACCRPPAPCFPPAAKDSAKI